MTTATTSNYLDDGDCDGTPTANDCDDATHYLLQKLTIMIVTVLLQYKTVMMKIQIHYH